MEQDLLVFITVAENKNFSRAAEELHMTQPAISRYIKSLEIKLNTRLFERNNKMVQTTKSGEIVYHHAKEMLALYEQMQQLINDLHYTASGKLTIGASYTFGEYILPHIIANLRENFPLVTPSITIGNSREIVDLVLTRQLDVGIIEGQITNEKLHMEKFAPDKMVIVASNNHEKLNSPEQLDKETWIVREEGSGTREATERMFKAFSLSPGGKMEFGSNQIIKEAVEAGLGITFLSTWAIRKELELGTVQVLNIEGFPVERYFTFVTQKSHYQAKSISVFVELLRNFNHYQNILLSKKTPQSD
jgi:LysR family transcriptional regulator, transcriptional activator of the cysJI operon